MAFIYSPNGTTDMEYSHSEGNSDSHIKSSLFGSSLSVIYEALQKSSDKWHQEKHDINPWLHYFLGTIISAYKEFEQRAGSVKSPRGAKTGLIIQAINNQSSKFSISDIEKFCPGISRDMVRIVFRRLQKEKKIACLGKGQSAKWKRIG